LTKKFDITLINYSKKAAKIKIIISPESYFILPIRCAEERKKRNIPIENQKCNNKNRLRSKEEDKK